MREVREQRDLLLADVVLARGLAPAGDVSRAIERYWGRREQAGSSLHDELARLAGLDAEQFESATAEVERLLVDCGGDATKAFARRGGVERSIHLALSSVAGSELQRLAEAGVIARTPLRRLDPERYVAFRTVGEGGMGVVYSALDTELNRVVALKLIRPGGPDAPGNDGKTGPLEARSPPPGSGATEAFGEARARFLQEAWITAGLEHPGIVPIHEIGETPGAVPYYTMRFVPGLRTLDKAIADLAGHSVEDRLALVEPFLRLCDAVAFAHSKSVIHRDIKPANVALGDFGEVVLLDWGIAKLDGRADEATSRWQSRVREYRGATDFHTMTSALGTPGYMSPEAAIGEISDVDARSDVYSLGAVLFEILTGRLPHPFATFLEYATKVTQNDSARARTLQPATPEALDDLCARCLLRDRDARPADASVVARAIRAWQTLSATEREVSDHLRDAKAAIEAAGSLTGVDRLQQTDRAAAALSRVRSLDAANADAAALSRALTAIRETGLAERDSAARRRVLVRGGIATLVVALVAAALVARALNEQRKEADAARGDAVVARAGAETAKEAAEKARAGTQAALDEVLRLADSKRARDLLAETEALWPATPEKAKAMVEWIERARALVKKRTAHQESLARLRGRALPDDDAAKRPPNRQALDRVAAIDARLGALEAERGDLANSGADARLRAIEKEVSALTAERLTLRTEIDRAGSYRFESAADEWRSVVLLDLLADLTRLADPTDVSKGVIADLIHRHAFASTLAKTSVEDCAAEWLKTIAAIAESPKYGGLRLRAQVGLVPLGPDPDSGLFEFAHLGSGPVPTRDAATRRLSLPDEGFAIVLVLIPGLTFHKGAQRADPKGQNFDPEAEQQEGPVWPVTLSPYFLSKYECTQAQWMTLTGGENPSVYRPGQVHGDRTVGPRNPVEEISWDDCAKWLPRFGLSLPTEAQWEAACRAGTTTIWATGDHSNSLQGAANVADTYAKHHGGSPNWRYSEEIDDGHLVDAPVGSFAANAFGLHDMHGNVGEWCQDTARLWTALPPIDPLADGPGERIARGGSWYERASRTRSASRGSATPTEHLNALGVRPGRSVTGE